MSKFRAPAPPYIPARWHGGPQVPTLGVIHSMVTPCQPGVAESIGQMFAHAPADRKTSAHLGIDPEETRQYVHDHVVAYHCGHNDDSVAFEMADNPGPVPSDPPGSARWKALKRSWRWILPNQRRVLRRTAKLAAQYALAYDWPIQWLNKEGLRRWEASGHKAEFGGFTTHALMSATFHESTHWDPGFWPRRRFMRLVRAEAKRLRHRG